MTNNWFYTVMLAIVVLALWGCDDDKTNDGQLEQTPVVLMGKAYTFSPEDTGEQWKAGKNVGIYMLKENTAEYITPYRNVKYQTTVQPEGYFTPQDKEKVMYYPQDGSKVDVIAYYPWTENLENEVYPVNVNDQKTNPVFSFLYARNAKGVSKDNKKAILQFRPILSQIVFQLQAGDGVTDEYLKESVIKVSGMNTKADFNLLSGQFNPTSEVKEIEFVALTSGNGASGQVLPTTSTEGYEAEIKLPNMNRTYYWELSEGTRQLEQGMRYICSVRVDLDKIEVTTETEAIEDWTPGNNHEGTGEENLIQTAIEDLSQGQWISVNDPLKVEVNTWCHQATQGNVDVNVEYDEALRRNVIHGNFIAGNTWYRHLIAYRMGGVQGRTYTLKFKAKGTNKKDIRCYIKTADNKTMGTTLFTADNLSGGKYVGYVLFKLTEEYQEYELNFNFTKMVASATASYVEADLKDVTPEALANFFIAFTPTSAGTEFYLDDVILKEKK